MYEEVTLEGECARNWQAKVAHQKVEMVLNHLLLSHDIRLSFVGPMRLKRGVTEGRLMAIAFGGLSFLVHIDGYKTVKRYLSQFWEVIQ
jgi:hypothetical protein